MEERKNELLKGNLLPMRAAEILVEMTALMSNVNKELLEREMAYKKKLHEYLEVGKSAAYARITAEITQEYYDYRVAQNVKQLVVELVRSLKSFSRTLEEEMRLSK